MSLFRRTSRKWRGVDFMSLVPCRVCEWSDGPGPDKVVVLQPRYRSGLLAQFVQPRLKESKQFVRIPLEERGTFLWRAMDGEQTVGELVGPFSQKFDHEADSVPERVATYLYQMAENKLIDFVNLNV